MKCRQARVPIGTIITGHCCITLPFADLRLGLANSVNGRKNTLISLHLKQLYYLYERVCILLVSLHCERAVIAGASAVPRHFQRANDSADNRRSLMKKSVALLFCLSLVAVSVYAGNLYRVEDNVYYSTYPKLTVHVDKEFQYKGGHKYTNKDVPISGILTMSELFSRMKDGKVTGDIVINFETAFGGRFMSLAGSRFPNVIQGQQLAGTEAMAGKNFYYGIKANPNPSSNFPNGSLLIKYVIQMSDTDRFSITYAEDLQSSGSSRSDWTNPGNLNDAQRKFLMDFKERASKAFQIRE
jgi:hypothetical protein